MRDQHVDPSIAIDIAVALAVVILERPVLLGIAWFADRVKGPFLCRLRGSRYWDETHLSFRLRADDEFGDTIARHVAEIRRLAAGAVPDHMLLPQPFFVLRVLVPPELLSGE